MYGVMSTPYMSQDQYNQIMQNGMNQYGGYYGNMGMQNQSNNTGMMNRNQNVMQILKGRPVSGVEEARASMIDLDGSMFLFPDIANRKIYTKQINLNGEPEFKTYMLVEEQKRAKEEPNNVSSDEYVLKSDFENIINSLVRKIKVLEGKKDATDVQSNCSKFDEE